MSEATLSTLLGAMGASLLTAVGALGWVVRRQHNNHESPIKGLAAVLEEQTKVLREMMMLSRLHQSEAHSRHELLKEILTNMKSRL